MKSQASSPIKVHFASLSLGASVDQQTGNMSVFDIIEEIRTPQVPINLQSMVISLAVEKKQPIEFRGRIMIHILLPDGTQQSVGNGEMHVPAEQRRMRALFRFGGFPIHHFGMHRFVLSWLDEGGGKIGEALIDFDVIQVTQVAQGVTPREKPTTSH